MLDAQTELKPDINKESYVEKGSQEEKTEDPHVTVSARSGKDNGSCGGQEHDVPKVQINEMDNPESKSEQKTHISLENGVKTETGNVPEVKIQSIDASVPTEKSNIAIKEKDTLQKNTNKNLDKKTEGNSEDFKNVSKKKEKKASKFNFVKKLKKLVPLSVDSKV